MRRRDFFRKTQRKRYVSRSHVNPYFREKIDRSHWLMMFGFVGSFLMLIAAGGFFLLHPFFQIEQVRVTGVVTIDKQAFGSEISSRLDERLGFFFKRRNRFLFDPQRFIDQIKQTFTFADVTLNVQGKNLNMTVVERTSQLIWRTNTLEFLVDLEGVVIRSVQKTDPTPITPIPIFLDRNPTEIHLGDSVLTHDEIVAVFAFHERLSQQGIAFTQTEFDRLLGKWVGILTTNGYRILFDPSSDIDAQADRLELLMKEKIKDVSLLKYIDLRFGDHVYYK